MMVGEVRDVETARIAIQAALTGHLVFSTLHTNDAPSAVTRMLDFGVEPYLLASSVLVVIAQRLVRLICPECRESLDPDATMIRELAQIGVTPDMLSAEASCSTGVAARTASRRATSTAPASTRSSPCDDAVKDQIMTRASATDIKRSAVERGRLRTLRLHGAEKVCGGITTVEEVVRVTQLDVF